MKPQQVIFDNDKWGRLGGLNIYTNATVKYRSGDESRFFGMTPLGHALMMAGIRWSYWSTRAGWSIELMFSRARQAMRKVFKSAF